MKRVFIFLISLMFIICLIGCSTKGKDILEWTNDEAIYVSINEKYREEVLDNLYQNFENYNYKKVYITEKETYDDGNVEYQLLFIINCSLEEFTNKLKSDKKIKSFRMCKDLPYDSFDNRYMKYDSDEIFVGDTLTISLEGKCDLYNQPFFYDSFYIKPINYDKNKEYDENDFLDLKNIDYIEKQNNRLLIGIKNANYYELIKTIDLLSKSSSIQSINLNYIDVIHPIWEINNREIVDFIINNDNTITLIALKPGVINVRFDGIECNITIISNS